MSCAIVPIVIPCLEPDERFCQLLAQLTAQAPALSHPVVVVDDGSGPTYADWFARAQTEYGATVLTHETNLGKGRALKDAFAYCLQTWPELVGCVTADSDGQHLPQDIYACAEALVRHPDSLVLGIRDFSADNVPWKSRFGNRITCLVLRFAGGVAVRDTQTGLRCIPAAFLRELIALPEDRFEFETRMLLETRRLGIPITEQPISTVYDSREHHSTHFHPLRDSWRIYKVIGAGFVRFLVSSLSSSVIDLVLFALLCQLLESRLSPAVYPAVATVGARLVSAFCNYLLNYRFVFQSSRQHLQSLPRYCLLAAVQMAASALLTTAGVALLPRVPALFVKIPVDITLFLLSYTIQKRCVY